MRRILSLAIIAAALFPSPLSAVEDGLTDSQRHELIIERDRLGQEAGQLRARGRLDEAIARVKRMVEIERQVSGPTDPEVAAVIEYSSSLFQDRDDWAGAAKAMEEVVRIDRERFGPKDWRTRSAENALATVRAVGGLPTPARAKYRASVADHLLASKLRSVRLYDDAEAVLRQALAIREEQPATRGFPVAECLVQLGQLELDRSHWAAAADLLKRAEPILRSAIGRDHRDRLVCLHFLGLACRDAGDLSAAREFLEETLKLRRQSMPRTNPILGQTTDDLADVSLRQARRELEAGNAVAALEDAERAFSVSTATLGSDDDRAIERRLERDHIKRLVKRKPLDRANVQQWTAQLETLAGVQKQADQARAFLAADEIKQQVERVLGADDVLWAQCIEIEADLALSLEQFDVAEELARIVVSHRVSTFGQRHSRTTRARDNLAEIEQAWSKQCERSREYGRQEKYLKSALESLSLAHGPDDWRVVGIRIRLRSVQRLLKESRPFQNDYGRILAAYNKAMAHGQAQRQRAEPTLEIVRTYFEQRWDGQHPLYPSSLLSLGVLALDRGDNERAGRLLKQALGRYESIFGPDHPQTAQARGELAVWHMRIGDFGVAEPLWQRAIASFRTAGDRQRELARALDALGQCYLHRRELSAAEPLLSQALNIRFERRGPGHSETAQSWNTLASFYRAVQKTKLAVGLYKQAAYVWRELGNRFDLALCLDNLANALLDDNDSAGATAAALEARDLLVGLVGTGHRDVSINAAIVARCQADRGNYPLAAESAGEALTAELDRWERTATELSPRQRLAQTADLRGYFDLTIRYGLKANRDPAAIYADVLRFKGAVLARDQTDLEMTGQRIERGDADIIELHNCLSVADKQFASRLFAPSSEGREDERRVELAELFAERDRLQTGLMRRCRAVALDGKADAGRNAGTSGISPSDLSGLLPPDVALIDFCRIYLTNPPNEQNAILLACICAHDQPVEIVSLGDCGPIDRAIREWRTNYGLGPVAGPCEAANTLRKLVWDRLPKRVHRARVAVIVPEGPLARFPWAALPGNDPTHYLLDDQLVAVVPSAQMAARLLRLPAHRSKPSTALLAGGLEFGASQHADTPPARRRSARPPWRSLPGTARELDDIGPLFAKAKLTVRVLRGGEGTESALRKELPKNEVVHLATHGFYDCPEFRQILLQATLRGPADSAGLAFVEDFATLEPTLLSGIVLSGANLPVEPGSADDGLLTALELIDLDLSKVQLVTISACESGLGESHVTEGALGLTRAMHAAGARTCVTSLWQVNDAATAELMKEFYANWLGSGQRPLEALTNAQRSLLRKSTNRRADLRRGLDGVGEASTVVGAPYYWAAFVLSGDWR